MKKIAIKVHGDKALSAAVQHLLFGIGYEWCGSGKRTQDYFSNYYTIGERDCEFITHGPGTLGFPVFDARAEPLGKLIELLTEPLSTSFQDGANTVIVSADGSVKYGCTTVSKDTVDKIFSEREKLMKGQAA